jgi:hypothetical protein
VGTHGQGRRAPRRRRPLTSGFNRWGIVAAAAVAAAVFLFAAVVPPAPARVDVSAWGDLASRTAAGAYHVHTTRSDGHGDKAAVAAAASRAGLTFVILTDHGDGTRPPDPPAYVDGVLVLDAVEISTDHGHYVALDMPRAPYPLGGAADAVVEDVARLGGFGIAAHPDSPKPALQWTADRVPADGIEWLNLDSEWRDESRTHLARAGIAYAVRKGPALAALLDRPATLDRWDKDTLGAREVALAAVDAHGGVGERTEDPNRSLFGTIGIPGYDASFRTFSTRVVLDRALTGKPDDDARAVYAAIRKGRVFSAIDALAGPALLDFHAEAGGDRIEMGDGLPSDSDVTIVARAAMPPGAELGLVRNGRLLAKSNGELRRIVNGADGAYRVEIRLPDAPGTPPIPWVVSNPIYFNTPDAPRPRGGGDEPPPDGAEGESLTAAEWRIEKDPTSSGILRTAAEEVRLEYRLGDGDRHSQFVALATDVKSPSFTAIDLALAGERPQRVSVQVRRGDGKRWGRSVYVDPAGANLRIQLSTLRPIGDAAPAEVAAPDVSSVLLVVDLTNASPGRSGVVRLRRATLVR